MPLPDLVTGLAVTKKLVETIPVLQSIYRAVKARRYPKTDREKTGILVAIEAETPEIALRLRNDFTRSLETIAIQSHLNRPFQIIELPQQHIPKIKDVLTAQDAMEKCGATFLIHGHAKNRNLDGHEHTILDIRCLVAHKLVVQPISDALSQEMHSLLPKRVLISKANDLLEMEVTAVGIDLLVRYFVATAAFLSEDYVYSRELLKQLRKTLDEFDTSTLPEALSTQITTLKKKTTFNMAVLYRKLAHIKRLDWRKSRDMADAEAMIAYAEKVDEYMPDLYGTDIARSLYHFLKGDLARAIRTLERWKATGINDATWALNMAFLYAFNGKLTASARMYKIALRRETSSVTLLEVEEFLEWALITYPSHFELHYCLGVVFCFFRDERGFAKTHFEAFLKRNPEATNSSVVKDVERYVRKLDDPDSKLPFNM
jgi:tetratricopeptide (TPR) repeat protein